MGELRCSVCGKTFEPASSEALPFCSPRCKQVDLGRWLDEKYGLPFESEEEKSEASDRDGDASKGSEE